MTDEERILNAAKEWVRRCTNAKQENDRVRIGVEAIVTNGRITDIEVIDRRRA